MQPELMELNQKLDALTAQVAYLTEQAQAAERSRAEREELVHDVMPIAKDALNLATVHLQDVEEYVRLDDLLRMLKKLQKAAPDVYAYWEHRVAYCLAHPASGDKTGVCRATMTLGVSAPGSEE